MVYGARLESACPKGLVGSNPTSSASWFIILFNEVSVDIFGFGCKLCVV